jgi:tetratricopeptide (TPR) repeat protein
MQSVKKKILILLNMLAVQYHSQTYSLAELDTINSQYRIHGDKEDAVNFNLRTLHHYKEAYDIEGTVGAYINLANLLCTLHRYKESLSYLDEAKAYEVDIKNPVLKSRLYNEYGRNYSLLGLYKRSNISLNSAIRYGQEISDIRQKKYYLNYSYYWKWYNFDYMGDTDSLHRIRKINTFMFASEPLIDIRIAEKYIKENTHLDSAEYYLSQAEHLAAKNPTYQQALVKQIFGNLYSKRKDYKTALDYYYQSLAIYQKMNREIDIKDSYKFISQTYRALNDNDKATAYLEKYTALNHAINADGKKALDIAFKNLTQEKEKADKKSKLLYLIIFGIILLSIAVIYFILKRYIKKENEIVKKQSIETKRLKDKINISFDEIIHLAQTGNPFFLTRFKQVYPDFYDKLLMQEPDLTEHDIKLCAYLKLNLSNKEIAQYENVTLRAIQTKRYRLKKKMQLTPDVDLTKWILEL